MLRNFKAEAEIEPPVDGYGLFEVVNRDVLGANSEKVGRDVGTVHAE
jgi:hypothetical protein